MAKKNSKGILEKPLSYNPESPWESYPEFKKRVDVLLSKYRQDTRPTDLKLVLTIVCEFVPGLNLVPRGKKRLLDYKALEKLWEIARADAKIKDNSDLSKKSMNYSKVARIAASHPYFKKKSLTVETLRKAISEIHRYVVDPKQGLSDTGHLAVLKAGYLKKRSGKKSKFQVSEFINYYCLPPQLLRDFMIRALMGEK